MSRLDTSWHAVNLRGWTLSDADHHTYRFDYLRLVGRQSVRVHTGTGRDTDHDLYQDRRAYVWNNDTDTATLRDERGHTIDVTSWGRGGGGHRHVSRESDRESTGRRDGSLLRSRSHPVAASPVASVAVDS
jgi:hypothetical protein